MDRNTIIAIVLSVIVITVGMTVNAVLFPPEYTDTTTETTETIIPADENDNNELTATGNAENTQPLTVETEAYSIGFDPTGASIDSIEIKNHKERTTENADEPIIKV